MNSPLLNKGLKNEREALLKISLPFNFIGLTL